MRARTSVVLLLLVAALLVYGVLIGYRGVILVRTGTPISVLLGLAVLLVPLLGLALVGREIQFGRQCARLGARLESEGGLPDVDLPRRPSGRVDRQAADVWFREARAETEAAPEDWRSWFRLALAYDAAGDRTRGRAAARHAIALYPDG